MIRAILIALSLVAGLGLDPARAVQPDEILRDPALEQRARGLSRELRCMVCQNESIDESNAPLARDLRILVRERLTAGDSDQQVLDFLVTRYGDFVLLRPRFSMQTALLWGTPIFALVIGALVAATALRRRARSEAAAATAASGGLTPEEEAKLARILDADRKS